MERLIGKYLVIDNPSMISCNVFDNNTFCELGSIDGVTSKDLDEEIIEEMFFCDLQEDECWID